MPKLTIEELRNALKHPPRILLNFLEKKNLQLLRCKMRPIAGEGFVIESHLSVVPIWRPAAALPFLFGCDGSAKIG